MKILCLHGFLGGPADYSFLEDRFEITAPNLLDFESKDELFAYLNTLSFDLSIGYSMGGRILMDYFQCFSLSHPLYVLGSHLGLTDKQERAQRVQWEETVIDKMKTQKKEDFLAYWNQLPIFRNDKSLKTIDGALSKWEVVFNRFSLSKMPTITPRDNFFFFVGSEDNKYQNYYKSLNLKFDTISQYGHRIIRAQKQIIKALENRNDL